MKIFKIFPFFLAITVTLNAIGQCPTPQVIWDVNGNNPVSTPCGSTTNIEIIVSIIRPSSVDITNEAPKNASCFDLPSGWSFVSYTGAGDAVDNGVNIRRFRVTLKPSATTGGTAKVRNGYTCVIGPQNLYSPWVNFTIIRPTSTPSFTNYGSSQVVGASRLVCSSTNFSVNTPTGITSYSWQGLGGVSASSSTNTALISASNDGEVRVYGISACGVSPSYASTLVVATPPISPVTYTADGDGSTFVNMCTGSSKYLVINATNANVYNFQLLVNQNANLIPSSSNSATFNTYNTGTYIVEATASNCKGSLSSTKYINVMNCGGGYYRIVSNPTRDVLTLDFDKNLPRNFIPQQVKLVDKQMKTMFEIELKDSFSKKQNNDTKLQIDVSKLPEGEYYLHIFNPEHPLTEKKVEKVKIRLVD